MWVFNKPKTAISKQREPEYKTIHNIAKKRVKGAAKELDRAMRRIRVDISANEMARGFESGDLNRVQSEMEQFDILEGLTDTEFSMQRAAIAAAEDYAKHIRPDFQFDSTDPAVASRLARFQLERIAEETNEAIKEAISSIADVEQLTSRQKALLVHDVAGTNRRGAKAVIALLQSDLEKGERQEIALGRASRYAKRLIDERIEVIAENEMLRAANEGADIAINQAKERGIISGIAVKVWIVTPDDRLCPICRPMANQEQPTGGKFVSSRGLFDAPPAHPSCRCIIAFKEPRG